MIENRREATSPISHLPASWRTGFESKAVLNGRTIHVVRAGLDLPPVKVESLRAVLSKDEIDRSERFKFEVHRDRFIASRGILRVLLGRLAGTSPNTLRIREGERGKPSLARPLEEETLEFNMSHTQDVAVYAFALGREVGVDVEFHNPKLADDKVAESHFSEKELKDLDRLSGPDWEQGFFHCWTRKEAFIKATGEGLYRPLDSFDVTLAPGEPAELLRIDKDPEEAGRWKMYDLDFGSGYSGALVAEGTGWEPRFWMFEC